MVYVKYTRRFLNKNIKNKTYKPVEKFGKRKRMRSKVDYIDYSTLYLEFQWFMSTVYH